MINEIKPYVISIQFDSSVERVSDGAWVIGADIQIGDELLLERNKDKKRLFRKETDGNVNGDFIFIVCSPEFKNNPTEEYRQDVDRAYVQSVFNKSDAIDHITNLINSIGRVSLDEFTRKIHLFLLTEEWDYLIGYQD